MQIKLPNGGFFYALISDFHAIINDTYIFSPPLLENGKTLGLYWEDNDIY
tara:strand:- start:176 stop:325 length:150 start_codon:yes stop_codon:yes gene_type:complete